MSLFVFILFVFVWYFPIWKRQGKTERLPRWAVAKTIAVGAIPAFLAIILLQIGLGWLRRALPLSEVVSTATNAYISAAVVEEGIKFLAAYLMIRKFDPKRKVDYVLIFGAVGLGYEVTETLLLLDGMVTALGRGILAMHILWQLWMGMFFWEYRRAKAEQAPARQRRSLLAAFAVPILFHGTNDFLVFMAEKKLPLMDAKMLEAYEATEQLAPELQAAAGWLTALFVFIIIALIFQIITFRMAMKTAKESRVDPDLQQIGSEIQ